MDAGKQMNAGNAGDSTEYDPMMTFKRVTLLAFLGIPPGIAISFNLASVGYFKERLHNHTLFGMQTLVFLCSGLLACILMEIFGEMADRKVRARHVLMIRVFTSGLGMSAMLFLTPYCESVMAVLLVASSTTFCSTLQCLDGRQIGAMVLRGGGPPLALFGYVAGAALPSVVGPLSGFQPSCVFDNVLAFYYTGGILCIAGTVIWTASMLLHPDLFFPPDAGTDAVSTKLSSAETLAYHSVEDCAESQTPLVEAASCGVCEQLAKASKAPDNIAIFITSCAGWALLPAFPLLVAVGVGPQLAYIAKIAGDLIGRVTGMLHSGSATLQGQVDPILQLWCRGVTLVRSVFCIGLLLKVTVLSSNKIVPIHGILGLIVAIYASGQHVQCLFDTNQQLQATHAMRKSLSRFNMTNQYGGMILGSLIGLCLTKNASHVF